MNLALRTIDPLYRETLEREFAFWPGVTWKYSIGGKHAKCEIRFEERSRVLVFPLTPSDARGHLNCKQDARRTLRDLGAVRSAPEKSKREGKPYRPQLCT